MQAKLKKILRNIVVKTSFWPFSRLYELYYNTALKIITHILKKQKEVVAVYLVAGMAAGDYVYGLSDIDLIVIVKDGKENKSKIDKIYRKLAYFIPVLLYEERGIFTTEEIFSAYKERMFYLQYKFFIECRKAGKLLYGKDILKDFPELSEKDNEGSIINQLTFIWAILVKNFLINNVNDMVMQNYLCYKLSAEICKAFILVNNGGEMLSRKKALERIKDYLEENYIMHIEKMQELSRNSFDPKGRGFLQDTYNFCFYLLNRTVGQVNNDLYNKVEEEAEIKDRFYFGFESPGFILSDVNKQKIDNIVDLAQREYKEHIQSILISPFDLTHIDEQVICLFIIQKRDIPIETIKKLNAIIGHNQYQQRLYLYIVTSDMAASLNRADFLEPYTVLLLPRCPYEIQLTFLYLSMPASVILGEPLDYNKKSRSAWMVYYFQDFVESIPQDKAIVLRLINDQNIVKVSNLKFQLFFWQALRLKLVETSVLSGKILVPLSSAQVYQQCSNSQIFNFPWLKKFHDEYKKDLNGMPSDSEAYFPEAIAALKSIYNLDSKDSIVGYE
jgi:predicted nucleotidyltransferase